MDILPTHYVSPSPCLIGLGVWRLNGELNHTAYRQFSKEFIGLEAVAHTVQSSVGSWKRIIWSMTCLKSCYSRWSPYMVCRRKNTSSSVLYHWDVKILWIGTTVSSMPPFQFTNMLLTDKIRATHTEVSQWGIGSKWAIWAATLSF